MQSYVSAPGFHSSSSGTALAVGEPKQPGGDPRPRTGIYVDCDNTSHTGARVIEYDVLCDFFAADGEVVQLAAFCGYDPLAYRGNPHYARMINGRKRAVEQAGGHLHLKHLKEKTRQGLQYLSGDTDAVLVLRAVCDVNDLRLKRIVFVTGDGDFVEPVFELRRRGVVVEVVGFRNVHWLLKRVAARFIDGFSVEGLIRPRRKQSGGRSDGSGLRPTDRRGTLTSGRRGEPSQ